MTDQKALGIFVERVWQSTASEADGKKEGKEKVRTPRRVLFVPFKKLEIK